MIKQVATLLLICYSVLLLRPLVPAVQDVMAHMFWNSEHMATVHYENGKYHVHIEISKGEESSSHTSKSLIKTIEPLNLHLATEKGLIGLALTDSVKLFDNTRHTPPRDGFFCVPSPPPWIVPA